MQLTEQEWSMVRQIAERDGLTVEEAASALISAAIARRFRKRTGHAPAKVYPIRRPGK